MRKILALALALCAPWPLAAQNAITQEGTVLQNSPMMFRGNNRARQGATVSGAPTGQTVTTGDSVVGGRCDYSAPTDDPLGYYRMCIDAKTGTIRLDGTKTPPQGTIKIVINGTSFELPGTAALVGSDAAVSNTAALKNVIGTPGKHILRLGFWGPGDGGVASYNWQDGNCAAADDGAQVQPSGTGCWVADFTDLTAASVSVWGVDMTATIPSEAMFQKAINWQMSTRGSCLLVPVGGVRLESALVWSGQKVCIRGVDRYKSAIFQISTGDDIFRFNGPASPDYYYGATISDLALIGPGMQVHSNGSGMVFGRVTDIDIKDVIISNTYEGIRAVDAGIVNLTRVKVQQTKSTSYSFEGQDTVSFPNGPQAVYMTDCTSFSGPTLPEAQHQTAPSINVNAVGELHINGGTFVGGFYGMYVKPSTAHGARYIYANNVNFESARNFGVVLDSRDGGTISEVTFTGGRISHSEVGNNLRVMGPRSFNVVFSGVTLVGSGAANVVIENVRGITFTGNHFLASNLSFQNLSAIEVNGGENIAFVGNLWGDWMDGGHPYTTYSLFVDAAFAGGLLVVGNDMRANTTAPILNNAPTSNWKFANNLGLP